ncbi:hypothetical protein AWJ20_4098 [Sugiyamaella lignohabitans]|uniref:Uncharacterized protein n=1 Tax=Sugiyamaella lignohabitans TaxID=796027 RepID=A0A167C6V1_9ASCO|nr:uncharacterized protein AWJ20_4098 [Sugiyamaella lignohabitans]ANB11294.1 hypothetical protein AWJ20_4098 [Sugiyamaella lignohabitans]
METLTTLHFFYLGGSIPSIIQRHAGSLTDYLKALLALFKEYESIKAQSDPTTSRTKSVVGVGRRLFRARVKSETSLSTVSSSTSLNEHHLRAGRNSSGSIPSSLAFIPSPTTSSIPEYSYLSVCHLPFVPDLAQTFLCLCETLIEAYKHIDTLVPNWQAVPQDVQELVSKLDDKVYKNVVAPSLKDIETPFRNVSYTESPSSKLSSLLSRA